MTWSDPSLLDVFQNDSNSSLWNGLLMHDVFYQISA